MILKKIIVSMFAIVLALSVSACDSAPESNLTMEDFVSAMETAGATLNEEPPLYQMVFAAEGVMLDLDGRVVKIYRYLNEKDIERGVEAIPAMSEAPRNGLFVLDSNSEKALEIFNNVN